MPISPSLRENKRGEQNEKKQTGNGSVLQKPNSVNGGENTTWSGNEKIATPYNISLKGKHVQYSIYNDQDLMITVKRKKKIPRRIIITIEHFIIDNYTRLILHQVLLQNIITPVYLNWRDKIEAQMFLYNKNNQEERICRNVEVQYSDFERQSAVLNKCDEKRIRFAKCACAELGRGPCDDM